MRELFVQRCEMEGESGGRLEFDYFILADQMESSGELTGESYGIKVSPRDGGEGAVSIPNITASASRIGALVELLIRNTVTPVTVGDVINDWL